MVRCGSVLDMYGGRVEHNFAGGYGGGIVAWNGDVNLHGGSITENQASFGGGIGIAASFTHGTTTWGSTSTVTMTGGTIAYNEAITSVYPQEAGYGGGICAGSGNHQQGAHLKLSGGTIQQNRAGYGGGIAVYAKGGRMSGANSPNTDANLSGNFVLTGNSATYYGNGMYLTNTDPNNTHALVTLSGAARVDTNNPVYFANVARSQVPVHVADTLTTSGTAAIFQFSESFWNGTDSNYAAAAKNRRVVTFAQGLDVQENKIALESTAWYLAALPGENALDALALREFSETPLYTIRNGTPVTVGGKK